MLLPVIPRKLILRVTYHSTYCLEHFKQSKMKLYQIIVEYNTPQTRCTYSVEAVEYIQRRF